MNAASNQKNPIVCYDIQSKITHCEFPRDLTTSVRDTGADLRQH
jgi:hypothetical protein